MPRFGRDASMVFLAALSFLLTASALGTSCRGADASAVQPIAFPHVRHTENQIDCAFCHEYADRMASAGIPRTELCGSCHSAMEASSPETRKLMEYVEKDEPIPWVRLYQLPQYSYFPHKWHLRAGIECEQCHGDIGESTVAVRRVDLQMSWCISCHEKRGAPVDCVTCHK